ncbi:MAG TPA: zinc-dependent alcohol dehydrogenase family protein, partial [Acidimicrobiales bacterium]
NGQESGVAMHDVTTDEPTMRAAWLHEPAPIDRRPLEWQDRPAPEPGHGEVLVEVTACGVCRTDLQLCEGDLTPRHLPIVPGHQVVGRVRRLGDGVDGIAVGDRVGIAWIAGTCGRCRFCTTGRENLCEQATFTGWDRDGGYAELVVADAAFVHPLPHGYDDVAAAPLLCGGAIGYRCLEAAGAAPGQRLGLYGFGASATIVVQLAKHLGCEPYVVTRSKHEQARALRLGAVWAGSYDERPPVPLDAAITFAPVGSVVVDALAAVDRGGVVVVNAIHLDHIPELDYGLLWWERSVRSVANVTRRDVRRLLELAPQVPIVTEVDTYRLDEANDALLALREGRVHGAAVLLAGSG